mgnify:CR=1 FL=1
MSVQAGNNPVKQQENTRSGLRIVVLLSLFSLEIGVLGGWLFKYGEFLPEFELTITPLHLLILSQRWRKTDGKFDNMLTLLLKFQADA